jgi:hypothetical protein
MGEVKTADVTLDRTSADTFGRETRDDESREDSLGR